MKSSPWRQEKALNFMGLPLRALGWSLLAHALLLVALAPYAADRPLALPPAAILHARLQAAAAIESAPQRPEPRRPASQPVMPRQPLRAEAAPVAPLATVPPAPTSRTESAGVAASPDQATAPPVGGETVVRSAEAPATTVLQQEFDARGPSQSGLRQYRLALASEARRFRRYPEAARRAGLVGTAEVRVTVDAGGASRQVELGRSSGHAALDAAALEMLRQATLHATLPESLRGQRFVVLLPVVFEVEE
jgi:protein TonB